LLAALSCNTASGHAKARRLARELEDAFGVSASFDEGADLYLPDQGSATGETIQNRIIGSLCHLSYQPPCVAV